MIERHQDDAQYPNAEYQEHRIARFLVQQLADEQRNVRIVRENPQRAARKKERRQEKSENKGSIGQLRKGSEHVLLFHCVRTYRAVLRFRGRERGGTDGGGGSIVG